MANLFSDLGTRFQWDMPRTIMMYQVSHEYHIASKAFKYRIKLTKDFLLRSRDLKLF